MWIFVGYSYGRRWSYCYYSLTLAKFNICVHSFSRMYRIEAVMFVAIFPFFLCARFRVLRNFIHERKRKKIHCSLEIRNWFDQFKIFIRKFKWAASHNKDGHQKLMLFLVYFYKILWNKTRTNESRQITFRLRVKYNLWRTKSHSNWWIFCPNNWYDVQSMFFLLFLWFFSIVPYTIDTVVCNQLYIGRILSIDDDKQMFSLLFVDTVPNAGWLTVLYYDCDVTHIWNDFGKQCTRTRLRASKVSAVTQRNNENTFVE